jgi:hypothetical protein
MNGLANTAPFAVPGLDLSGSRRDGSAPGGLVSALVRAVPDPGRDP